MHILLYKIGHAILQGFNNANMTSLDIFDAFYIGNNINLKQSTYNKVTKKAKKAAAKAAAGLKKPSSESAEKM